MSRRTNAEIIKELRGFLERGKPYDMGLLLCAPALPREEVEARMKEKFELWRDSWITPLVNEIERRLVKRKKKGGDGTMSDKKVTAELVREIMPEWRDGQPGCAGKKDGKFCLKELRKGSVVYKNPGHLLFCSVACADTRKD